MAQGGPRPHDHTILEKKLYVIRSVRTAPQPEFLAALPRHMDHQMDLEKRGILFAAGPLRAEDGSMEGFIVIRAASFADARRIADEDPMHREGVRSFTLHEWTLNEGAFTIAVRLSNQTIQFD